ncbi:MAG: hypothetical protein J0L52_07270 [Caulobacterales bacterium]|nr:hypothetical protein [Caulobacterales bacterium]
MPAHLSTFLAAAVALAVPMAASAQDRLGTNQDLGPNQQIRSANGRFHLIMQSDCNLVLYEGGRALWASGTVGRGQGCRAVMQGDGNFVVYSDAQAPLWASNTAGRSGASLRLEDSGNLQVLAGNRSVWQSDTAQGGGGRGPGNGDRPGRPDRPDRPPTAAGQNLLRAGQALYADEQIRSRTGRYHLIQQRDCNLVLYEGARALWATGTHGRGQECRTALQTDGNLVVYDRGGTPLWQSRTTGRSNATLQLEDNGDLALYSAGRAYWTSGSGRDTADGRRPGGAGHDRDRSRPWSGADILRSGDELRGDREERLASADRTYILTLRRSCEVEITEPSWSYSPRWTAGTAGAGRNCRLVMRSTGELVLETNGRIVWSTGTSGYDVFAYISPDGDLILHDRDRDRDVFNSRRNRGRRY